MQKSKSRIILVQAEKPYLENGNWYYQNPFIEIFNVNGKISLSIIKESDPFCDYELVRSESGIELKTENQSLPVK